MSDSTHRLMAKDEWAIVLDFLPKGHTMQSYSHSVAQIIGTENFNLLEVIPREGKTLKSMDKVYIGEGKRDDIQSIIGKIPFNKLTEKAKSEISYAIKKNIRDNENKFINILNKMESISPRTHALDYLGLSHIKREEFISARKIAKYNNLKDIFFRTKIDMVPHIIKHLLLELNQNAKHYFFIEPLRENNIEVFLTCDNKGILKKKKKSKKKKVSKTVVVTSYPKGKEPYKKSQTYTGWKNLPRGYWGKKK